MTVHEPIEQIYWEIRQVFKASSSELVGPPAMRGEVGFAALYTPPRYQADLAIVGQNPGNFGPNDSVWDDETNRSRLAGEIPILNSYTTDQHNFAIALRRYFAGDDERLLRECIGLNLWFFQARGTPKPPARLASFCERRAEEILRVLEPRAILCLSKNAFDRLRQGTPSSFGHPDAPCALSAFQGIPLVRAHHPTGSWSRGQAELSIPEAIIRIKAILADRDGQFPLTPSFHSDSAAHPSRPFGPSQSTDRGRHFRITEKGQAFVKRNERITQLRVVLEVLSDLGGAERRFVAEQEIVERMGEHPFIRRSVQSPKKLLDWYRTHQLISEGLVDVTE